MGLRDADKVRPWTPQNYQFCAYTSKSNCREAWD